MDDKQCEIMTCFEYVFGCVSSMRQMGEQELVFMYSMYARRCVSLGAHVTASSSVFVYLVQQLCVVCMSV